MKRHITEKYPHLKENFSNARFRQALIKGQESNEIVRPKSSEETGLKGYFLLNRALYSQKDKVKAKEPKTKKSADREDKVKQPAKVARKTKTSAAKSKTASKPAKSKSEPKAASDKDDVTKTSTKEDSTKGAVTKKTSTKAAVTKKASTKAVVTTAVTKTAVKKSQKATSTPKIQASKQIIATPKLSKSATAGPRMKVSRSLIQFVVVCVVSSIPCLEN